MPVLSIIACDMLEDELAYVLSKDSELEQLILVEKMECFGLRDVPFFRQDSIFYGTCGHSLVNIVKDFEALEL